MEVVDGYMWIWCLAEPVVGLRVSSLTRFLEDLAGK